MLFNIYETHPKQSKKPIAASLDIDRYGFGVLISPDQKIIVSMQRVSIIAAGKDGIRLSGFKSKGIDVKGCENFIYQEWWLAYREEAQ